MANIQVKIQLQDTVEDVISGVAADKSVNNVSALLSKNTSKNEGTALLSFALGYLKFDDDGNFINADGTAGRPILERSYNGFVFGATNDLGEYFVTVTVSGTAIDSLVFYGDKAAGQYATEAYLDGDTSNVIYSDDNEWAVKFSSPATSHSITFTKWKRINYNACITHIAVLANDLWLDKAWIKSVESVSQSTGQPNELFYGVIANSGSVSFVDRSGELLDYVNDGIIDNSNLPVSIYANGKQVQAHIVNDSDYDKNSITLSFEMTNDLELWETVSYGGYAYPETGKTAYDLLYDVLSTMYGTSEISEMLSEVIVVGNNENQSISEMTVANYLSSITIKYPYIESGSIKSSVEKICTLAQLQVYKTAENKIKFVSARPIATASDKQNVLVIPAKCQQSQLQETVILKNKYGAVDMTIKKANAEIDYETVVGNAEQETFPLFDFGTPNHEIVAVPRYSTVSGDAAYARVVALYARGRAIIPIHSNNNLEKIIKLWTGNNSNEEPYIKHTVFYTKRTGTVQVAISRNEEVVGDIVYNQTSEEELSGVLEAPSAVSGSNTSASLSDKTNLATLNYTIDQDGNFVVDYYVLVGTERIYECTGHLNVNFPVSCEGKYEICEPSRLEISFYGDKWTLSFEDMSASDSNVATAKTVASVTGSEVLQNTAAIGSNQMAQVIKSNIREDYSDGISDATITVVCADYYNTNGEKIKTWASGDIIDVGDIVRIDKDNMGNPASVYKNGAARIWRVTGRTFRKEGVPLIDLELQEVK